MNKKFILTFVLLFTALLSFSQTYRALVKSGETGEWGYIDNSGELVIPAKFDKCHEFSSDGFAPVYDSKKGGYYFINPQGEALVTEVSNYRILPAAYGFDVLGFHDGFVPVKIGSKCGYMNTEGKLAVPAKYDEVLEFNSGSGVGRLKKQLVIVNEKGEEFIPTGISEIRHFSEGLAPFKEDKSGKFGFVGPDGSIVIPAQFLTVGYFSGGLAWARVESGKIGFIDTKGAWALEPKFDVATNVDPESGIARVKIDKQWTYVNAHGEVLTKKDTDTYGDFNGSLALGKKNDKVGFFDFKGDWVIQPTFEAGRDFKNGFAAVKAGGKWGFIDTTGNWVVKPTFESAKDMELIK